MIIAIMFVFIGTESLLSSIKSYLEISICKVRYSPRGWMCIFWLISDLGSGIPKTKIHKYWEPWLQKLLWRVSTKLDIHHVPWDESCCDLPIKASTQMSHFAVCQSQLPLPEPLSQWEGRAHCCSGGRAVQWCLANPLYCQRSINPRSM